MLKEVRREVLEYRKKQAQRAPEAPPPPEPVTPEEFERARAGLLATREVITAFILRPGATEMDHQGQLLSSLRGRTVRGVRSSLDTVVVDDELGETPLTITAGSNFGSDSSRDSIGKFYATSGYGAPMRIGEDKVVDALDNQSLWLSVRSPEGFAIGEEVVFPPVSALETAYGMEPGAFRGPDDFVRHVQACVDYAAEVTQLLAANTPGE